ncbi:GTPase HflX [Inquilinus limosus]|uniref:GTPase HflX n=1 Tax=Inquilinus limosus TaxID=171674 RepID=UPI003F16646C
MGQTSGPNHGADGASSGRAIVIHPVLPGTRGDSGRTAEASLEEAVGLSRAISLDIAEARCVRVSRPQPSTLIGEGALEELSSVVAATEAGLVVVDATLSPVQQRNLERRWKTKVIDRTGLILEIFGERARTREGQLQVELAHLSYQRSRLVRSWTHLERQRGGAGFLGGPGETQIELDRRQIDDRIIQIKRQLEEVRRTRSLHREARARVPYPVVALVGYTNAGKSTLFNRLTRATVLAKDMLFATLDPTMRAIEAGQGRRIILSDTVGFISDLPTHLVAAFRATLEEVQAADLILHVRDVAHPDTEAQREDVEAVLRDLDIDIDSDGRVIEVLNKADLLPEHERETLSTTVRRRGHDAAVISALTGEGCDALMDLIARRINADRETMTVKLDIADGRTLAWLHRHGEVLEARDDGAHLFVRVRLHPNDAARLHRQLGIATRH